MGETQSKSVTTQSVSAAYEIESAPASRLLDASIRGNLDAVLKLLRRGKKINKVDDLGDTALHKAAAWGHVEIVAAILKKHSELSLVENAEGLTPFHLAAHYGKLECARLLLDASPKLVNVPFARNPVTFDYSLIGTSFLPYTLPCRLLPLLIPCLSNPYTPFHPTSRTFGQDCMEYFELFSHRGQKSLQRRFPARWLQMVRSFPLLSFLQLFHHRFPTIKGLNNVMMSREMAFFHRTFFCPLSTRYLGTVRTQIELKVLHNGHRKLNFT